ncbi:tannase-domain-containing protein [Plenodomus tracheiphilus IPT5]|uniref:Carboxylic ester hydrolase n=1 Tax=Plenodomus tracheiphilus IPT5 TaxID=1408161 RepID=A0A6A7B302_9PLEO|nr:tannase-domain-containing protein [Plenodomus tracheiphilus IPT5]
MVVATLNKYLLVVGAAITTASSVDTPSQANCASSSFSLDNIVPGVTILSIEAKEQIDYTSHGAGPQPAVEGLRFCQVKIFLTHQSATDISLGLNDTNDKVLVEAWLPLSLEDWNGRFQATGGAGFTTGMFDAQLGVAVQSGWAAVSTDGGHNAADSAVGDASWAMNKDKSINWHLLQNFASRSIIEQIPIGKRITEQYYGSKPHHSYWNGCSTGGLQGYAMAQRFPHLVDGILANAPAINFPHLVTSQIWPQLRMLMTNTYLSKCELEYYQARVIEACDSMDGVLDGILEDPEQCDFDVYTLVGVNTTFQCDGKDVVFTSDMARIITEMHQGPGSSSESLFFPGLAHGVPMGALAKIKISKDGVRSQNPSRISSSWLKYLVLKDPTFDLKEITDVDKYFELFGQASYEFGGVLATNTPDLSALEASGTKMVTWHGINDQMIPYQNTVAYRRKVEGAMGGAHRVDDYFRLFLAPGLGHCGGGIGAQLKDPLGALVDWVEHDTPPETLDAEMIDSEGELVTKDICAWPAKSKYMGIGNAKRASSWSCVGGTERPSMVDDGSNSGHAQKIINDIADRFGGLGLGLSIG